MSKCRQRSPRPFSCGQTTLLHENLCLPLSHQSWPKNLARALVRLFALLGFTILPFFTGSLAFSFGLVKLQQLHVQSTCNLVNPSCRDIFYTCLRSGNKKRDKLCAATTKIKWDANEMDEMTGWNYRTPTTL